MTDLVRQLPPYISTRISGRLLCLLFATIALVGWLAVGYDIAEILRMGKAANGEELATETREAYYVVGILLMAVQSALILLSAFGFLAWLFRARVNVRAFGLRRFEYSREWTVLGFLIPLLNFVRPYQVVSEIWRASDPSTLDPFEWKLVQSPNRVRLWWVSFGLFAALGLFAVGMSSSSGPSLRQLQVAQAMKMFADAASAISAVFALLIVSGISRNQDHKAALLARREAETEA